MEARPFVVQKPESRCLGCDTTKSLPPRGKPGWALPYLEAEAGRSSHPYLRASSRAISRTDYLGVGEERAFAPYYKVKEYSNDVEKLYDFLNISKMLETFPPDIAKM